MNKLFIHTPIFRFLSPIFSGIVAYLLILLINNNIVQLQEEFLGQELYVCITLSYIIHEFSRLLLRLFKFIPDSIRMAFMLIIHLGIAILLSIGIITLLFSIYYKYVAGYAPSLKELLTFNSIYCCIPVIYVLLSLSHQYLHKINTKKLETELLIKQNIEEDFKQFKREINLSLLFESFEFLLVLIKEDKNLADKFIANLATIYRYILTSKKEQLVAIKEEIIILDKLVALYNHLPYRKVNINVEPKLDFLIVPGTLLHIIEQIIKTTIVSTKIDLAINIVGKGHYFTIDYLPEDKIVTVFNSNKIEDLISVYSIYSTNIIAIKERENQRIIRIPTLRIR